MTQLVVDYTFRPLVWSDGTPVTAEDSVFSFEIARDRATPRLNVETRYTAAYEATGERSVRWTGLPGYRDPAFMTHVWPPLPLHQLGDFAPAELPVLDEAAARRSATARLSSRAGRQAKASALYLTRLTIGPPMGCPI